MTQQTPLPEPSLPSISHARLTAISVLNFFWRPWWKGIVWICCFAGVDFSLEWLSLIYLLDSNVSRRIVFTLNSLFLNSSLWIGAFLAWKSLHLGNENDISSAKAKDCRILPWYLSTFFSLFVLIVGAKSISHWIYFYSIDFLTWKFYIQNIGTDIIPKVIAMNLSLLTFMLIFKNRPKRDMAGIIIPCLLTILLSDITYQMSMYGWQWIVIVQKIHLPLLLGFYSLLLTALVMSVVGYFVVRRLREMERVLTADDADIRG